MLDDAHALATTAGDSLDDERIADGSAARHDFLVAGACASNGRSVPGTTGTPARIAMPRAAVLLPISAMASGEGPMNVRPASRHARGERRILGEKSIAWMDRVGAGTARNVEQRVDIEVAAGGLVRPEVKRLIGFLHVARRAVAVGIDGDSRQPHLAARANDSDGDLAAVGDQDFH